MILTESQFPVYLTQLSSGDQHIDSDSDSEYLEPPVDDNNRFGPNPLLMHNPAPSMRTPAPTRGVNNPMPTTSPVSGNMDSSSVNDRLKDLNKMFEDGLIDEKDFKSKKKTLLDEL
ncbi:MAG: SHOCT domain-containing protein [Gammaproteobacteria bacterium]